MVLVPANVEINHAKAVMIASRIVLRGEYFRYIYICIYTYVVVLNARGGTRNCRYNSRASRVLALNNKRKVI